MSPLADASLKFDAAYMLDVLSIYLNLMNLSFLKIWVNV